MKKKTPRAYFVEYNLKFMAIYKTVRGCVNYISKKGWVNDDDNVVRIYDTNGDEYNPINGEMINE